MADRNAQFQERLDETRTMTDPHRQFHTIRFDDGAMDFVFQWMLGFVRNGGGEIGELFTTAARITDADPDSWAAEWPRTADRVAAKGRAAASGGHRVSAREFLLRASCYYRAALASLSPEDPEFLRGYERSMRCFSGAAELLEPPIEPITVPFEDTTLPGCFIRAGGDRDPRGTLLAIGGGETFFTDLYFHIGPAAVARGYNFLTVDIPGQGILPATGHYFRPDTERPIGAVIDYALSRPEVDGERLAAYGISGGGYYVPRAAAYDTRIKACIANCGLADIGAFLPAMVRPEGETAETGSGLSPFNKRMYEIVAWRSGVRMGNLSGLAARGSDFVFDPKMITCPVRNICGEGEYLNPLTHRLVDEFTGALTHPRSSMIVAPFEDGTGTHCLGENAGLLGSLVFDWLDELFA